MPDIKDYVHVMPQMPRAWLFGQVKLTLLEPIYMITYIDMYELEVWSSTYLCMVFKYKVQNVYSSSANKYNPHADKCEGCIDGWITNFPC